MQAVTISRLWRKSVVKVGRKEYYWGVSKLRSSLCEYNSAVEISFRIARSCYYLIDFAGVYWLKEHSICNKKKRMILELSLQNCRIRMIQMYLRLLAELPLSSAPPSILKMASIVRSTWLEFSCNMSSLRMQYEEVIGWLDLRVQIRRTTGETIKIVLCF